MLKTAFWKSAVASLPAPVRARYIGEFERAERLELALDGAIGILARARAAFGKVFHTPRSAH